jgi:putative oxidoreductase
MLACEIRMVPANLARKAYHGTVNRGDITMSINLGLLLLRIAFGISIAGHGSQKLFGWFAGHGLKGTGQIFEGFGFRPGIPFAAAAGVSEFVGGILLALGLFTPFGAAAVLAAMLVAMLSVHLKNKFFAMANGMEFPFLYAAAGVSIAFTGAGAYSCDAAMGLGFVNDKYIVSGILLLSVLGAGVTLALRRQTPQQASTAHT